MSYRLTVNREAVDVFRPADLSAAIVRVGLTPETDVVQAGEYTLGLRLPRTAHNERILRYAAVADVSGGGAALPRFDAVLTAGDTVVLTGRLEITDASASAVNVRIIGDNADWSRALDDKKLGDLPLGSLDYVGDASPGPGQVNIIDVWNSDEASGLGVQFPLIAYGNFPADPRNSAINPLNGVTTIADSAGQVDGAILDNRAEWPLSVFSFRPCLYIRPLIRAILTGAGLSPSGPFFEDPDFANLLLPYVGKDAPLYNLAALGFITMRGEKLFGGDTARVTARRDVSPYLATFRVHPVPGAGEVYTWFDFETGPQPAVTAVTARASFTITNSGGVGSGRLRLIREPLGYRLSGAEIGRTNIIAGAQVMLNVGVSSVVGSPAGNANLAANTRYRLVLANGMPVGLNFTAAALTVEVKLDPNPLPVTTATPLANFAPDIGQREFLVAVLRHLSLYLTVTGATAIIAPRKDYLVGGAVDWTSKTRVDHVVPLVQPKRIRLAYGREAEEVLYPTQAFDARHENAGTYYTGERVDESLFAATGVRTYRLPTQDITLTLPTLNTRDELGKRLGELGDGRQSAKLDYRPRILRWEGLQTVANAQAPLYVDALAVVLSETGYPVASFAPTLHYGGPTGLYERQHRPALTALGRAATVRVRVYLTRAELAALNLRRPVIISGVRYAISRIVFDLGQDGLSEATLLRM